MKTIYKYPFRVDDEVTIRIPRDHEILHVDLQGGQPCLWAKVDTDEPEFDWKFRVFGTGHEVIGVHEHVATFQQGPFVWHLFTV